MTIPKFSDSEAQIFFDSYYIDRGMMKWQGFYLSDHTSALKKEAKQIEEQNNRIALPKMAENKIFTIINQAILKNKKVSIQLNQIDSDGYIPPTMHGKIVGFKDKNIYFDNQQTLKLNNIRNIRIQS